MLDDLPVYLHLVARQLEADLLARATGQVADELRERVRDLRQRSRDQLEGSMLEILYRPVEGLDGGLPAGGQSGHLARITGCRHPQRLHGTG